MLRALVIAVLATSACERAKEAPVEFSPAPDQWDFYPSRINDAPASVMVNLWFGEHAPITGFGHLLWVFVRMDEPDEHRMGTKTEAERTQPIEDELGRRVEAEVGAHFVARIRGEGEWQLYFYGRDARRFDDTVRDVMRSHPLRSYELGDEPDPEWKIFRTVLYPDAERQQWMGDRGVVEAMSKQGDPLTEPRRVDHWIYFDSAAQRSAFADEAKALGFTMEDGAEGADPVGKLGLQVHRVDHVDLDRIHDVVMTLADLAEKHGAEYDGWETEVRKPTSAPPPAAAAPTDPAPE